MRVLPEHSRAVLVTGGSRGIGRAIVARLLEDGYEVFNFSRTAPGQALAGETFVSVDLSQGGVLSAAIAELVRDRPVLNLINNAGMIEVGMVDEVTDDAFQHTINLNMLAPLKLLQGVLPGMRAHGYGRVINIGSRAALGKPGRTAYGATKAALAGMTRTWALELAPHGITVNTVAPGPVITELFDAANPSGSASREKLAAQIPVGRIGQPDEIAHIVASLIDPRAAFMTGQVLQVCGGMTVGMAT